MNENKNVKVTKEKDSPITYDNMVNTKKEENLNFYNSDEPIVKAEVDCNNNNCEGSDTKKVDANDPFLTNDEYIENKAKDVKEIEERNSSIVSDNVKFEEKLVPIDGVGIDYHRLSTAKKSEGTTESTYCPNGTVQLKPDDTDLNNPTFEDISDLAYGEKDYESQHKQEDFVNDIWMPKNKDSVDKDS